MQFITARPLTKAAFASFGEVIETDNLSPIEINKGYALRFTDLASVEITGERGRVGISIFEGKPRTLPLQLDLLERHPLGTQAFIPLSEDPFVIVVAKQTPATAADLEAFVTNGRQGVSYRRNAWHHPLLALVPQRFAVIDRLGSGDNLEEWPLSSPVSVRIG